jgi:hypothetical protein
MKTAIIACCKMEELYIREWLDWHLYECEFDHIFLCDNNDSNYFISLSSLIQDYIDSGKVTIYNYNDVHPIQPICYNDVYQIHGEEYDWFTLIDIDEFYCLPNYNNKIKDFLNTIPDSIYNLSLLWRMYGDNELIKYDPRPVQIRFKNPVINRPIGFHWQTKPLFRGKSHFKSTNLEIISQHTGLDKSIITNKNESFLYDVLFNKISNNTVYSIYNDINLKDFKKIKSKCYLKHYFSKSIEEWIKYKTYRGDTLKDKNHENYPYTIGKFFKGNLNKITCEKINFIKTKYENLISQLSNNKNICYTVIIGKYDSLKEPLFITDNFDYVCFTDQKNFNSDIWTIIELPELKELNDIDKDDLSRINRCLKWLPHLFLKEYDYSIYVDGSIQITGDLNLIKQEKSSIMHIPKHNKRTNVYEEIDRCIEINKDDHNILELQRKKYINENYPENLDLLFHNTIICRYHNDINCIFICDKVWDILCNYSYRDQIALPYVLWKYNMINKVHYINYHLLINTINYKSSNIHDLKIEI